MLRLIGKLVITRYFQGWVHEVKKLLRATNNAKPFLFCFSNPL